MAVKLQDVAKKKWRVAFWYLGKHYAKIVVGDKRRAMEVESKMRAELAEGTYFPHRNPLTVEEIADTFMTEYAVRLKSRDKLKIYVERAKRYFKGKKATEISPDDVGAFRDHLSKDMHPVSVNHYHRALRRMFNWAIERGKFRAQNPASGKLVKFENERKYWRTKFPSPAEVELLLTHAAPSLYDIILCANLTGMRKGEIENMKCKDVDLDKCLIFIQDSKNDEPAHVPFPETLFPTLKRLVKACPNAESFVFNFVNFDRLWGQARLLAGQRDLHFHDLRHGYASNIMENTGGDLQVTQEALRHKDFRMTLRYSHLAPGRLRKAVLTLDKTFAALRPKNPVKTPLRAFTATVEGKVAAPA